MSGPSPAAKRFVPTQTNKEGTGNDVMAELQALLKGRRASTDRVLGSPRAQRKAAAGKSNSVSEKRMNSAEKVSSELREPERASSQGPNSNTKWHVPPPSSAAPTKKPIHPPLKASPIPIPGASTSLIPDPGLHGDDIAESPPSQSRAAAFTSSVGAITSMSVTNNNQSPSNSSGSRAALTQSLPKSNLNRIGPPPNAPPPRLIQQGNSISTATTSATAGAGSSVTSSPGQMSSGGARKVSGGSPFPPKMTQKTSNITFNEPVKATKKGAGKKAPLVTSKSSASVGIKRLLFKKKGNKKDSEPVSANLKKTKSEQKFNIRPLSPEGDQISGSDSETPIAPVSCSVPMSTSTPSFAYQNVFDDQAFISRNQHKFEDAHMADKKPMPLPRKNSLSGAAITSIGFRSGGRSQEIATAMLKEEEVLSNQDSGTDSPTPDKRGKRDSDSQMWHIGSISPTSSILAGVKLAERRSQPGSPSSVQSPPPAASSPTGVLSPTSKGRDPRSVISPEPKKKRRSTEAFLPVTNVGGSINLLSDLSKYPLFQSDPAVSVSKNASAMRSGPAKKQELVKTTSKGLPGSVPMRRRSTPREVRRAVMSDGAQLDLDDNDDDYIPMNPIRVTTSMNFLEVSQEETFPMDPRASGYYLKILAPDEKAPSAAAAKEEEMDECPSSPDSYDEVNLGPIITVPVRESVMSPEDEYVSISAQRPHSIVHDNSKDTGVDAAGVDKDHPLLFSPSIKVQSEDLKEPDQSNQRPAQNNFQISEESGGRGLKYSDVTITPVGSEGNPVKRKPSAPKKFSYQLVQLTEGKQSKLEDSGAKQSNQPANKHETGMQRRGSEPAVASLTVEGERKISAPAGLVHSVQPAASRAAVASASVHREKDTRDSLSRLADRPLPKVPEREKQQQYLQKQEESQEDTDDDMEEVDENLYYVTTSSFAGKSDKAEPPPLSVAVPGQVPAGRVVWHEYVEIDEEEIVKMGGAMPPLPGQLLRLMPLLRSDAQEGTTTEPMWRMTTFNSNLDDDDIDMCAIDRSDSLESCPYIEPPQIGSPPVVPDRPDNLDDLIKRKAVASGEYSYAAVPGQSFGVRWMHFHSSNPRHISLAPVSSKDQNQAFILAPESEFVDKDSASSSGGKQNADGSSQQKPGKKVSEEGFYPPLLPPKSASLLREQREDRPQSYLIPVLTKKKKRGGVQTNINKGKSKSTSQLAPSNVSRDAATGERMEGHKGEAAKKKKVPPLKPKPYKESKTAKHQRMESSPEGLKVMVMDEDYGVHDPGKAEGSNKSSKSKGLKGAHRTRSSTTRMDLSPSDAIGDRLTREKSPSLGNLLETSVSSDFDSREKWIDHDKENPIIKPAKTSQKSGKLEKKATSSAPQSIGKHEEESGDGYLRKQSMTHRPSRSDAVKRRPKNSRDSPGVESDSQDLQAKDASLAVIRRNRETIVKHLSRALDMENLDLDFEQSGAAPVSDKKASGSGGKGSQSSSNRGLGDILSELDSLLKNNVCSTEDLLQAIQSRLNIKVNIQGDQSTESESDRNIPQSKQEEVSTQHMYRDQDVEDSPAQSQETHDTGKQIDHGHETKAKEEGLSVGDVNSPESENTNKKATRAEGTAPYYVNDEVLLNWKGLKMVTYTPDYMNAKYIPGDQSDASAPNSQSSDQSSSSNDPTSYEDVQKWIDATNKTESHKSNSSTKTQVKSKSPTAKKSPKLSTRTDTHDTPTSQEGASSMKEKSKRKIPLQPPIRMRSQSSIDVSPKLRRKKLTNPPPEVSELDSPTHGYQLALRMEDERMFSTVPHRRTHTVTAKDSGSTRNSSSNSSPGHTTSSSPRLSSSTGQSSSSAGQQRPNSGHRLSSDPAPSHGSVSTHSYSNASNDASPTLTPVSPQPSQDHLSVAMSSQQRSPSVVSLITHPHADLEQARASQKLRHHYQNLFSSEDDDSPPVGLLESTNIRDSRSFSAGSRPLQRVNTERRSTNVDPSVLATAAAVAGGNVYTNGVGVFTHKGGVLMNAGSGVVIEVPEDAIPRGKKQKLWFEVKQDVINPLQDEGHDSSHALTDSFQFSRGSAEFENYLAGKRERKVQLSPMILIGPSDAVFSRPIKIKMPHCLPYRNNSWHLHMFAKAQTSETGDWTELSNTIGLVDLPPRRVRSKLYEKSSYQMHIDYTQVRTKQLGYFKLTGSPIRNGSHSAKRMVASVFTKKQSTDDKMLQLKVFINNAIQDQIQALDKTLSEKGYGCLERNIPILCFGDGKDMELILCSDSNSQMPLGTRSIPFGLFWRQTTVGQSHVSFEVDSIQLSNEGVQALTLRVQQAGSKLIHETNFLLP